MWVRTKLIRIGSGNQTFMRPVPPEIPCLICFEDIDSSSFVEFQASDGDRWRGALFCWGCIQSLQRSQFSTYKTQLANSTCAKETKQLLARGPPINLRDAHGFPGTEGSEVHSLRLFSTGEVLPAKLVDSLEGDERLAFWETLREFTIVGEAEYTTSL